MNTFIKYLFIFLLLNLFTTAGYSNEKSKNIIYHSDAYTVFKDSVRQKEYLSEIISPTEIISNYQSDASKKLSTWKQEKNLEAYPLFSSDYPISDAIYNMSVEEMTNLMEADQTWRTGESWGGVWTRDVSYSILLAMSYMHPEISKNSLLHKVRNGMIIQDTGTGGSYPISTDRIIWAVAAWQIYLVTGEKEWLAQAYNIIKNTLLQDEQIIYNPKTGLVKGESSFLDWREQEYPRWMQPADIYESECLGTNAVHYQANIIAAQMAAELGDKTYKLHFEKNAECIQNGINNCLWMENKGFYAQYLYGRNHDIRSPRSETLGESLCILWEIATPEQSDKIISSVVQTPYGNSCFYPQIPNIAPYHNDAIWPFVQSYWMWAAAKTGNEAAVTESIAAIYRAAALFTTNKENFIDENGDFHTDTNSNNMLWSIAGSLSIVHRIFFGITFEKDQLTFAPFIPQNLMGKKNLKNFKYRKATLDIEICGYGNEIQSFKLDGKESKPVINAKLKGYHKIEIILKSNVSKKNQITKKANHFSTETPRVYLSTSTELAWTQVPDAVYYKIIKNGKEIAIVKRAQINSNLYHIDDAGMYVEYQVIAIDSDGYEGFASEPLPYYNPDYERIIDMTEFAPQTTFEKCKRYTGNGAVEISATTNKRVNMNIDIPETGKYILDFRYANGNNTLISDNKCANRSLYVDNVKQGNIVFPQRGWGLWSNWGYSNSLILELSKGNHCIALVFETHNENMNNENVNQAIIDHARLIRME